MEYPVAAKKSGYTSTLALPLSEPGPRFTPLLGGDHQFHAAHAKRLVVDWPFSSFLRFQFRKNATEKDPVKVDEQRQLAMKGLQQLMVYTKMDTSGLDM